MQDEFGTLVADQPQGGERRTAFRRKQIRGAKIVYNNGHSVLDCAVRDMTEAGARLGIDTLVDLPGDFWVLFQDGRKRPAEVIWRKSQTLGVRFLDVPEGRHAMPGSGGKSALIDRIAGIERELAEIRAEIAILIRD